MEAKRKQGGQTTHGMSRTKVYKSYFSMMARCYDEAHNSYKYYGGRKENPIKVCDRWHVFENYLEDAVKLPGYELDDKKLSLDRIDVDGMYSPENCRWVSKIKQQNNKRNNIYVNWKGEELTLAEVAREEGIKYSILSGLYYQHKDTHDLSFIVEKAHHNQSRVNIAEVAKKEKIPYSKLYHQFITRGLPLQEAICKVKMCVAEQ